MEVRSFSLACQLLCVFIATETWKSVGVRYISSCEIGIQDISLIFFPCFSLLNYCQCLLSFLTTQQKSVQRTVHQNSCYEHVRINIFRTEECIHVAVSEGIALHACLMIRAVCR
jgi:hypothetical protein